MTEKTIPKATAKRFPIYLKNLRMLEGEGVERINSTTLASYTHYSPATIRKDFTYIGELGRSGYGYDVRTLIHAFEQCLQTKEKKKIVIVGCGNLGRAFLHNNFRRNENIEIVASFDTNPLVIGEVISGVRVYDMKDFAKVVKKLQVSMAITTVPSQFAESVIQTIVASNIKSILNFAPVIIKLPENVHIQTIDLTNEVQALLFLGENE